MTEPSWPDFDTLQRLLGEAEKALTTSGRPRESFRCVVRLIDQSRRPVADGLGNLAAALADLGFEEVGVDPRWNSLEQAEEIIRSVRHELRASR